MKGEDQLVGPEMADLDEREASGASTLGLALSALLTWLTDTLFARFVTSLFATLSAVSLSFAHSLGAKCEGTAADGEDECDRRDHEGG